MVQPGNTANLAQKDGTLTRHQLRMQHLDSSQGMHVEVFPQIDLSRTALSQQAQKLIIAKLLTSTIIHTCIPHKYIERVPEENTKNRSF
jgi:hypothetical protein